MEHNSEFFRPFPDYEDVFYDDIENHKKYFLPICSVNLKFMFPERDEWVHFISAKEMNVGHYTDKYHTKYTKKNMYSFDIIDGKYKFEADWNYFYINHKEEIENHNKIVVEFIKKIPEFKDEIESYDWVHKQDYPKRLKYDLDDLYKYTTRADDYSYSSSAITRIKNSYKESYNRKQGDYKNAELYYQVSKSFFNKYGHILERFYIYGEDEVNLYNVEEKRNKYFQKYPDSESVFPEYFGFIEDIKFKSKEAKRRIQELKDNNISTDCLFSPIQYNLWDHPLDEKEEFEYIGCIKEYNFLKHGATVLNVFHDSEAEKASMLLDFD